MGPNLIFDKSFLQCLNPDEAVWLDQFFTSVITPLYLVETLADLEKKHAKGRTPEQVVGNLAYKTSDMDVIPNSHHRTILQGELAGVGTVDMQTGRPMLIGGRDARVDGEQGVVFDVTPEEDALARWQRGEFLDRERTQARAWRHELSLIAPKNQRAMFPGWFGRDRPIDLAQVKAAADKYIDNENRKGVFSFGLSLLGVNSEARRDVLRRWEEAGQPALKEFAPYFRHVYGIELFFYLGRTADLISGRRTNKVDIAYLYYLPFCMVFASNDKLHRATAPLFLRSDQDFVWGPDLKADLRSLDEHYSALPDTEKEEGLHYFASRPPADRSFLVTRLWDRHMRRDWRKTITKANKSGDSALESEILAKIRRATDTAEGTSTMPDKGPGEADFMITKHSVLRKKGKWTRFPKLPNSPTDDSDS